MLATAWGLIDDTVCRMHACWRSKMPALVARQFSVSVSLISAVALTPLASSQSGQQRIAGIGLLTTDSSNPSGGLFADVIALVNDRRLGTGVNHHLMRHSEQQRSGSSPLL